MPSSKTTHHELTNFEVTADPDTDIWRKPPAHDVFNVNPTYLPIAPFQPTQMSRALVKFSGTYYQQFDQAGIVLCISDLSDTTSAETTSPSPSSWIKAGLEFYNGKPYISFVGCDRWADWSITPVRNYSMFSCANMDRPDKIGAQGGVSIGFSFDEEGTTLWAYEVEFDGVTGNERRRWPVRECTWLLHEAGKKGLRIGAYAARPAKKEAIGEGEDEVLRVTVARLEVDLREE